MISHQRNIFLILLANLLTFIRSQTYCDQYHGGRYTNNSTYQANLNTLLSALSTNIDDNGFYSDSVGQDSDTVNAYVLCRGDIQLDSCRSCVRNAVSDLVKLCPSYKQAVRLSEYCMVRYSNVSFHGTMDTIPSSPVPIDSQSLGRVMYDLRTLLENIRDQASNGGSLRKVAASNRSTIGNRIIYGMVQCTPDLSREDCYSCLNVFIETLQTYNSDGISLGARIHMPSCNIRYEIRHFYNETRLQELEHSSLVPTQVPPVYSPPVNDDKNKRNNSTRTIIIIVISVVAGLIIVVLSGCFIMKMKLKEATEDELAPSLLEGNADEMRIFDSLHYNFGILKAATNDFSEGNKLGQGGFGAVYKGTLPNGQEIAVKRLSIGSNQGDLEFKNEVTLLVKLQHRNLVRLLGYSCEGSEKLLVYEFVQNASLDTFIFDITKRSLLDWDKRYKIIGGIARGILYLHEDSRLTIIHRDLKSGNVLLDGNMNPKIADFGMARLFVPDETQGSTSRIVGTYGYMAPEYASYGQFSVKSDVFSFGVLLLEIISGKKNNCLRHGETKGELISSAWENWRQGTAANLVDPLLRDGSSVPKEILRCIHIGLLCVQENAVDRPTMASVITMLNSFSITLPVPSHPAFFVHNRYDSESLPLQEFSWGEENSNRPSQNNAAESISQNEMSISGFQAR